ncbi:phage portal protein [Qipengyuania sp. S6317L1]|uniref:phage portal protein n=1 Tax=Qipengyuania sp. S6317L1 TaxID=2926410 RepID=UPI001FF1B74D|nr:phage portal protein [Qipengyuania sp. S6317L1]MCK0098877.1 phage portal protein [Qipengyuania sp. S6317L1]
MAWLDQLLSAVKGGEDARVPLARGIAQGWTPAFVEGGGPKPYQYERCVREGFLANPIAQRAVRIVAEGVGQAPTTSNNEQLANLITATSAGQSLIETLASHLLLHGNGFVQIIKDASGRPIELFALRPDRVSVVAGPDGWPCAYNYSVLGDKITLPVEDEDGWPSVIQIKTMHPLDDYMGAGALAAATQAVAIHNAASEWNRALLENAARPSGALVYEQGDGSGLTHEQFERLKGELEAAFSGSVNAGRPMLLDGGLRWQSMAMSPADMDFATLKSAAAREIALAFGVPPMLLGLPGDNTYANYREANRALWRLTLLPLAEKLFSALREGLSPWFRDGTIGIDLDRITALSEDRERLWKQVSDADFLTRSEKRELLGLKAEDKVQ